MNRSREILVGLSVRTSSQNAIVYAAHYAAHTNADLRVIFANPTIDDATMSMQWLLAAVDEVRTKFPELSVRVSLSREALPDALSDSLNHAEIIFLDKEKIPRRQIDFVSSKANCPVATVASDMIWPKRNHLIVVGADGTARSNSALTWAFDQADRLDGGIRIIHCANQASKSLGKSSSSASQRLNMFSVISKLAARHPSVGIQIRTLHCSPVEALTWHSQFATMVVVGYGSQLRPFRIGHAVLRRAVSPVAIVGPSVSFTAAPLVAPALDSLRSM